MNLRYTKLGDEGNNITVTWKETNSMIFKSKCDTVNINFFNSAITEKSILTITILVTKGRIHIHGRYLKDWSNDDFPILVKMLNNPASLEKDPKESLNVFLKKISSSNTATDETNQSLNSQNSSLKSVLTALEADFVQFKMNMNNTMVDLNSSLSMKDETIRNLKSEIDQLKKDPVA